MLTGSFQHALDEKNRLSVPSAWREQLCKDGKVIYVTRGLGSLGPHLSIFSARQFEEKVKKISQLPLTDENAQDFLFVLGSDTSPPLEFDKQGRILIPQNLKDLAQIDKEVVLSGGFDRINVWNPKNWDTFYATKGNKESFRESAKNIQYR